MKLIPWFCNSASGVFLRRLTWPLFAALVLAACTFPVRDYELGVVANKPERRYSGRAGAARVVDPSELSSWQLTSQMVEQGYIPIGGFTITREQAKVAQAALLDEAAKEAAERGADVASVVIYGEAGTRSQTFLCTRTNAAGRCSGNTVVTDRIALYKASVNMWRSEPEVMASARGRSVKYAKDGPAALEFALAVEMMERKEYGAAQKLFEAALAARRAKLGDNHPGTAWMEYMMGMMTLQRLEAEGRDDVFARDGQLLKGYQFSADNCRHAVTAITDAKPMPRVGWLPEAVVCLGASLLRLKQNLTARAILVEGVKMHERAYGQNDNRTVMARKWLQLAESN